MRSLSKKRAGFTLVELLVVIAIIGILSALGASAYLQQVEVAKIRQTETLLRILDDELRVRLQPWLRGNDPQPDPKHDQVAGVGVGNLNQSVARNRSRLIAKLDAMRGAFPQQFIDFLRAPGTGATQDFDSVAGVDLVGVGSGGIGEPARNAIFQEYLKRSKRQDGTDQLLPPPPPEPPGSLPRFDPRNAYAPFPENHDPQTESSECLYLILTTNSLGGSRFDTSQIPASMIADTDDDGLLEFIDSWGNPIRFYRWPTDYREHLIYVDKALSESLGGQNSMDPDGYLVRLPWFRTDQRAWFEGSWEDNPTDVVSDATDGPRWSGYVRLHDLYANRATNQFRHTDDIADDVPRAYDLVPMIVSSGPDGEGLAPDERWRAFGLAWYEDNRPPTWYDLDIRSGRVGGFVALGGSDVEFRPDDAMLEAAGDNVVSILLQAGRE